MSSKITTDLEVDPPLELNARYRFNHLDRRYIDDQIQGIQRHLVDALIGGRQGSWYTLSGASAAVAPGDTVCLAGQATPLVTKALSGPLTNAGSVLGVVIYSTPPGGKVFVATGGVLPPSITGLGPTPGFARVNTATSRCEQVALLAGDYGVGTIDSGGNLHVIPGMASGGGGGDITDTTVTWAPTASPNGKAPATFLTYDGSLAVPAAALLVDLPEESTTELEVNVTGRSEDDRHFNVDLRGTWSRTGATVTELRNLAPFNPLAGNPGAWSAILDVSGTQARVRVTGDDAIVVRWGILATAKIITLTAMAAAVPVVIGMTYAIVDPAGGGKRRVVEVDDSTGCTAISAGGVAFTSFAIDDGTHVSGIPGAHAAGVVDVVVTNAGGPSTTGTGLAEYWSAASLGFELLHIPGTYSSGSWPGSASTGGSGARDSTEATNPPTVASGNPDFDGANDQLLYTGANMGTLATASAYTLVSIFNADAAAADGLVYDNPALICDSGGYVGLMFSDAGVSHYLDGAGAKRRDAACATGGWHLAIGRLTGGNMDLALDNTWGATLAAGDMSVTTGTVKIGTNYAGAARLDGTQRLVGIMPTGISNGDATKLYQWADGSEHLS